MNIEQQLRADAKRWREEADAAAAIAKAAEKLTPWGRMVVGVDAGRAERAMGHFRAEAIGCEITADELAAMERKGVKG